MYLAVLSLSRQPADQIVRVVAVSWPLAKPG